MPETRYEVIDGEVVYVSPADPPHASRHSKLSALLEAYVADGYDAASDMLTRTSEKGDMAPDGSIYPTAPDPDTGGRQLEELAFEIVSTEALSHAGTKAARLAERGVRRVFAIDVERKRGLEWSRQTGSWEILASDAAIADRALALPLPIRDLVSAAKADDAVARALLAKANPVIAAALATARAQAVLAVLEARGIPIREEQRAAILDMRDQRTLERWIRVAATCGDAGELFSA